MSAGGKCSLRFYIEGNRLITTGIELKPGRSASRLDNVIKIMEDLDLLEKHQNKAVLTPRGQDLHQTLEAVYAG